MTNKILIKGDLYENVALPESGRMFREAFDTPKENKATLDFAKVAEIVHKKRQAWREQADHDNFPYNGAFFDKSINSTLRIMGLLIMAQGIAAQGGTIEATFATMQASPDFIDIDGVGHPITLEFASGLFLAMGVHTTVIHAINLKGAAEIEAALAAKDIKELERLATNYDRVMEGLAPIPKEDVTPEPEPLPI